MATRTGTGTTVTAVPLGDVAWREAAGDALRERLQSGVATLPGFLSKAALAEAAAEARQKAPAAFVSKSRHNAFLRPESEPRLPAAHPRNRLLCTEVASVACDELDPRGALRRLYFGPEGDLLLDLLSRAVGKRLFRLEDKLGALSINVFRPGMAHAWHFDESEYTVTLCLQKAERGGAFVFSEPMRSGPEDLATERVEKALASAAGTRALTFEPGTLSIFCGQRSLHCVEPVAGARDRLVAVLCFATAPGVANSSAVQEQFWGRSKM